MNCTQTARNHVNNFFQNCVADVLKAAVLVPGTRIELVRTIAGPQDFKSCRNKTPTTRNHSLFSKITNACRRFRLSKNSFKKVVLRHPLHANRTQNLCTLIVLCASFAIAGCSDFETTYLCKDGVLYVKEHGAWIEALAFEGNRCLPMEAKE